MTNTVPFYDPARKQLVEIDVHLVTKTSFNTKSGKMRYALRGKTDDGRYLIRFITKTEWDAFEAKNPLDDNASALWHKLEYLRLKVEEAMKYLNEAPYPIDNRQGDANACMDMAYAALADGLDIIRAGSPMTNEVSGADQNSSGEEVDNG